MNAPTHTSARLRWRRSVPVIGAGVLHLSMAFIGMRLILFGDVADYSVQVDMLIWDLLAMVLLGGTFHFAERQSRDPQARPWFAETGAVMPPWAMKLMGWGIDAIPVIASMIGLAGAIAVLVDGGPDEVLSLMLKAQGGFTILLAWLTMHVSYSQRYAWLYYREGGGLEFPRTPSPLAVDFMYFALTLGSSFATSDVEIVSRRMRWHVLAHSVLSFFYNAIVLAIAVSLITSL